MRWLLGGAAAWYLLGQGFRAYVGFAEPSWGSQSLLWLPMYADLFAIGMAMAVLSAADSSGRPLPRLVATLSRHPAACWLVVLGLFVAISQVHPPEAPFMINGPEYVLRQFTYGVTAFFWLIPGMFGDFSQGRLRAVLRSRPFVYLGMVSFSFYLWHLAFVEQAKIWTVPDYEQLEGLADLPGQRRRGGSGGLRVLARGGERAVPPRRAAVPPTQGRTGVGRRLSCPRPRPRSGVDQNERRPRDRSPHERTPPAPHADRDPGEERGGGPPRGARRPPAVTPTSTSWLSTTVGSLTAPPRSRAERGATVLSLPFNLGIAIRN